MRSVGGFPAIMAALIAPIEIPAIHSGAYAVSAMHSYTPAWYAPQCATSLEDQNDLLFLSLVRHWRLCASGRGRCHCRRNAAD